MGVSGLLSYTPQHPPMGRYFQYESQDSTGSFHFGRLLGEVRVHTATACATNCYGFCKLARTDS